MHKTKIYPKPYLLGKDPLLDSMGIPMNPGIHVKQSKTSEFWTEFLSIFTGSSDLVGILFSLVLAIFFTGKWVAYLIGKFLLRLNVKKPIARKLMNNSL